MWKELKSENERLQLAIFSWCGDLPNSETNFTNGMQLSRPLFTVPFAIISFSLSNLELNFLNIILYSRIYSLETKIRFHFQFWIQDFFFCLNSQECWQWSMIKFRFNNLFTTRILNILKPSVIICIVFFTLLRVVNGSNICHISFVCRRMATVDILKFR